MNEIEKTIKSDMTAGEKHPRQAPARRKGSKIIAPDKSAAADSNVLDIWTEDGKLIPLHVARNIKSNHILIHVGGAFHEYIGGVYRLQKDWVYERLAIEMIGQSVKRGVLLDVVKLLQVETAIDNEKVNGAGRTINLANGLLDLDGDLQPHTPDFISTTQIPIALDPNALCPAWEKALRDWFPGEQDMIELIQEWFGYCLIPDTRQHKAMLLIGEGANGKSVVCDVLKSLVGSDNVSAVSLNALSRSFSLAELYGRLVNLTIEADIRDGIDEGNFKAVVAGDPIQAERKFKDPFVFRPFARFTIATNSLFHADDRSDGFYRRLLIVRFNQVFKEENQDRELTAKLQAELSGIFNWALVGLARLEQRGRFQIPQRVHEEVAEYKRHNNPVAAWAEECAVLEPLAWAASRELYNSYRKWAEENGHKALAVNKFGIELQRLPGVERRPLGNSSTRIRGYGGIRI